MVIQLGLSLVLASRTAWQEQSAALHSPLRNLVDAEPSLLGDRVGNAAARFLRTWENQVAVLRRDAAAHGDALANAAAELASADAEAASATQDLLVGPDALIGRTQ